MKDKLKELQEGAQLDMSILRLEGALESRFLRGAAVVLLLAVAAGTLLAILLALSLAAGSGVAQGRDASSTRAGPSAFSSSASVDSASATPASRCTV